MEISYVKLLEEYLSEAGITRIVPIYGTDPNVTAEQQAKTLLESLKRIEDGDLREYDFGEYESDD